MYYWLHLHSLLRWIVLFLLIYSVVSSFIRKQERLVSSFDRKMYVFGMIFFHIQFLLGISIYFFSTKVLFDSSFMKNAVLRFFTMEHVLGMLIAFILITVGKKKIDKSDKPYATILIYYGLVLLITLISIPWPFRNLGAAWI